MAFPVVYGFANSDTESGMRVLDIVRGAPDRVVQRVEILGKTSQSSSARWYQKISPSMRSAKERELEQSGEMRRSFVTENDVGACAPPRATPFP